MHITIVGAGAIGGTVGAYLARAGHAVLFCDVVAEHVAAINKHGLTIRGWAEEFTVTVPAVTPDELRGPLDLVLLAVKAQHTYAAMQQISSLLSDTGIVVSLQNGLNEQIIAEAVGEQRTIGCLVNFSADYLEPGFIHYGGPGALKIGELDGTITPRLEQLRDLLAAWGSVETTTNIWGYMWGKLGYANMLYATALADASMAEVIGNYRQLMVALASEVYEVADRRGVRPEAFDGVEPNLYYPREQRDPQKIQQSLDALIERRNRDQKQRSGIWRDIMVRRRRSEIDQQLVPVVRHGEAVGLELPLTRRLVDQIHALEQGHTTPAWAHLDALEQLRRTLIVENP
ncbi:MAG: 2-dehydropantoate 2-reductase [Roseiflexaceae bacterium]|nr:2-dehydropantoate 2-reductase [Roseiflexaceae bacterium]